MEKWMLSSSILILGMLALRRLLRGKISLRLQYALWLVVLLRLLLPGTVYHSPLSVQNWVEIPSIIQTQNQPGEPDIHTDTDILWNEPADQPVQTPGQPPQVTPAAPTPLAERVDWSAIAKMVWVTGMAVMALVFLGCNLHFVGSLKKKRERLIETETDLPVYTSRGAKTPCLVGLVRPVIYVTKAVMEDKTAQRHVLQHELTHYRHGDHIFSLLRCAALCLHWYNPLVWVAAKASREDGELACDEGAIARMGEGERRSYGETLIRMTCHTSGPGDILLSATTMTGSKSAIRERILLLAKRPRTLAAAAAVCLVMVCVLVGCTFTGAVEDAPDRIDYNDDLSELHYNGRTYRNMGDGYSYDSIFLKDSVYWKEIAKEPYGWGAILGAVTTYYGDEVENPEYIIPSRGEMLYVREDLTLGIDTELKACGVEETYIFRISEVMTGEIVEFEVGEKQLRRVYDFYGEVVDFPGIRFWMKISEFEGNWYLQYMWDSDYYRIPETFVEKVARGDTVTTVSTETTAPTEPARPADIVLSTRVTLTGDPAKADVPEELYSGLLAFAEDRRTGYGCDSAKITSVKPLEKGEKIAELGLYLYEVQCRLRTETAIYDKSGVLVFHQEGDGSWTYLVHLNSMNVEEYLNQGKLSDEQIAKWGGRYQAIAALIWTGKNPELPDVEQDLMLLLNGIVERGDIIVSCGDLTYPYYMDAWELSQWEGLPEDAGQWKLVEEAQIAQYLRGDAVTVADGQGNYLRIYDSQYLILELHRAGEESRFWKGNYRWDPGFQTYKNLFYRESIELDGVVVEAKDAMEALRKFGMEIIPSRHLKVPADNPYYALEAKVVTQEPFDVSVREDGLFAEGRVTYAIRQPVLDYMPYGNVDEGTGEWEGWLIFHTGFSVYSEGDGLWRLGNNG